MIPRAPSAALTRRRQSVPIALLAALLSALIVPTTALRLCAGEGSEAEFGGSLEVRIHPQQGEREPPAALLLADPQQRRVGWDPEKRQRLREIPGAFYESESLEDAETGDPGPVTLVLYVASPVAGDYSLRVIGLEAGRYTLEVRALDRNMTPSRVAFRDVAITAGAVDRYRIGYSNEPGSEVEVVPMTPGGSPTFIPSPGRNRRWPVKDPQPPRTRR